VIAFTPGQAPAFCVREDSGMSDAVVPSGSDSAHESEVRTSSEVRADYAFSLALGFFANALTVLVLLPLPALTGRKIDAGLAALRTMWFAAPTFLMLAAYTYVRARVPREISDEALGQIDIRSINWGPRRDSETTLLRGWSKSIGTAACWLCWLIGVGIVRRRGDQPWDLAIVGASGLALSIVLLRPFRDSASTADQHQ
jgi:hypothetical protein